MADIDIGHGLTPLNPRVGEADIAAHLHQGFKQPEAEGIGANALKCQG